MELQLAKDTINQAISIALQKGCYTLDQAQAIIHALEKINGLDDVEFGVITPVNRQE
jgi:hypothetical protein